MTHGGKRTGAGRPKGLNVYGESTKPLRIPLSKVDGVKAFLTQTNSLLPPLYASTVRAGFPSPADDYIEDRLDLNHYLIKHPAASFFVTASGDSMRNAGIHSGDLLIVDKSIQAEHGSIVIAALNGELTVKRLSRAHEQVRLMPENEEFAPIDISNEDELVIWGVVTYVIHPAS